MFDIFDIGSGGGGEMMVAAEAATVVVVFKDALSNWDCSALPVRNEFKIM
jgi:hypothetical protein